MYIGKVEIHQQWETVEGLIKAQVEGQSSFAFDSSKTYQLQAEGNYGVRLMDAAAAPSDVEEGFVIEGTQPANYKVSTGKNLYVKTTKDGDSVHKVLLKISVLGE